MEQAFLITDDFSLDFKAMGVVYRSDQTNLTFDLLSSVQISMT